MSIDYLMLADGIRAEQASVDKVPGAGKTSVYKKPAIISFLFHPVNSIRDIQGAISSLEMLCDEANERASKSSYLFPSVD